MEDREDYEGYERQETGDRRRKDLLTTHDSRLLIADSRQPNVFFQYQERVVV